MSNSSSPTALGSSYLALTEAFLTSQQLLNDGGWIVRRVLDMHYDGLPLGGVRLAIAAFRLDRRIDRALTGLAVQYTEAIERLTTEGQAGDHAGQRTDSGPCGMTALPPGPR